MSTPLVSICCITYNHASFIRQCIEGFLMQIPPSGVYKDAKRCDWCEILIHDDCSTDGTTEIIKEYALKYPDLIFPLYEEENQYSKGIGGKIDLYNYERAKGKYIAYCEGDDYWTDPLKLRRQVDFLETHSAYSVCFHRTMIFNTVSNQMWEPEVNVGKLNEDIDVTAEMFLESNIGQPLSMVFRVSCYSFDWYKHYSSFFDTIEIFHILLEGKGRFMRFIGGTYNLHSGGVSASLSEFVRCRKTVVAYLEMFRFTKEFYLTNKLKESSVYLLETTHAFYPKKMFSAYLFLLQKLTFVMWFDVCFIFIKRILRKKWLGFHS